LECGAEGEAGRAGSDGIFSELSCLRGKKERKEKKDDDAKLDLNQERREQVYALSLFHPRHPKRAQSPIPPLDLYKKEGEKKKAKIEASKKKEKI
jgi:hypothetical protein